MKTYTAAVGVPFFTSLLGMTIIYRGLLTANLATGHPPIKRIISHQSLSHSTVNAAPLTSAARGVYLPPVTDQESFRRLDEGVDLAKKGDASVLRGDWQQAAQMYQQSLNVFPDNQWALYGLGMCANAAGDTASAISDYRRGIYTHPDPPLLPTIREGNVDKLMQYALLLSQSGQEGEALFIYSHAVNLLDYDQGHPNIDVLLPDYGSDRTDYTPQRLQAMAHLAISIVYSGSDDSRAEEEAREALQLAPASPQCHYYLGGILIARNDMADAKAEFTRALALDDGNNGGRLNAAAKVHMGMCR